MMGLPVSIRRGFAALVVVWLGAIGYGPAAHGVEFSTVVIDAGHGGNDQGAFRAGVRESAMTLHVAERLEGLLKKQGLKTEMTRRSDVFIAPASRVEIANRHESSVFVSIHFNANPSGAYSGAESFYGGPASKPLAREIQNRMVKELNVVNRGIKRRLDLKVLRLTEGPAVLLECGFLSHVEERLRIQTAAYQQTLAQAICDGIMAVHEGPRAEPERSLWTHYALLRWVRHGVDQLFRYFGP